jgi:hypothetical protein
MPEVFPCSMLPYTSSSTCFDSNDSISPHGEPDNPKNESENENKPNKTCRCRDNLLYLHTVFTKNGIAYDIEQ